ncbi:MAG TPA: ABC transporter substrate-binding protein, partial [Ktedonobacterales bacterium]|nr:ABC transporter substrate-binding protein [Ktedonobacterales bacterium]
GQTSAAAAAFLRSFGLRYPGRAVDLDTAEAYDAAMLLITGINHLVRAGQAVTRSSVLEQVRRVQYAGLIGPISFDGNGDIAHGVFTVYRVQRDVWTPIQEIRA